MSRESRPFGVSLKTQDHHSIATMISSTIGLQGPRSIRSYESVQNARKRLMGTFSAACIELSDDSLCEEDGGSDDCGHFGDKKRRLTFDQVKTLEKSFEVGNKLDPERKMQLAMALGLQPRQIAVWFQNRRARWKNKQLEKDYDALKHDHDTLKINYDTLLQEHRQFKEEVQRLKRELVIIDESNRKGRSFEPESQQTALFNPTATSTIELTVKSEMLIETREEACEKDSQEGGCSSEGSSVLDTDSPRTIDSPLCPQHIVREVPTEFIRRPLVEQSDYCQKLLPKVEGGSVAMNEEEETCCNLFYSYEEEQGPMLWEYWSHEI